MIPIIETKTLVQHVASSRSEWFGLDYNMNIYRGCNHGCIYCDSRSDCYNIPNFDQVTVKKDALTMLSKELLSKRKKGVLGIGSMSDPYNPFEKQLEITRKALKIIDATGFGISLITKSHLVVRDLDILENINKKQSVIINITITCAEDMLSKKIEPNAPPSSKRFECIKQLSTAGIFCGVLVMPILPFINDTSDNIKRIVELSAAAGAKFVYPMFGVTLRDTQRTHFYNMADKLYPDISKKYKQTFHQQYTCWSPKYKELGNVFVRECKKHNMLYTMPDIIDAYKKQEAQVEQLSFPL
jgi:DNA repair photolyase